MNPPVGLATTDPSNDYLAILVGSNGRFNSGATGVVTGSSFNISYAWPGNPWSGFTTIRVDGADYIYGDVADGGTITTPPYDADAVTNDSVWRIGDIEVEQRLRLVDSLSTGRPDNGEYTYILRNTGTVTHSVGARLLIDTMLNSNDSAPFRIPGVGNVTTEMDFLSPQIPDYWQAFYDLSNPDIMAQGTIRGGSGVVPDRMSITSWGDSYDTLWDYTTTPGMETGDSAVVLWWNPVTLAPGEARTVTTYYGLGTVSGGSGLSVTGPAQLVQDGAGWTPNPFTITAYVTNSTEAPLSDVPVELTLPAGLQLAPGETATHSISAIAPSATELTSWSVVAVTPGTWTYSVAALGLSASRQVVVPGSAENHAPVATDDTAQVPENTSAAIDVLANDTDADGDALSIDAESLTSPSHGTATIENGKITYVPAVGYRGPDSFQYSAADATGVSNLATVSIWVSWENEAPFITLDPAEQTVQYSDDTAVLSVSFGDNDGPEYHTASYSGLPQSVAGQTAISGIWPYGETGYWAGSGSYTFGGLMDEAAGDYAADFTISDSLLTTTRSAVYHVAAEDASIIGFTGPTQADAGTAGVASAQFSGTVQQADDGYPGDLTRAVVRVSLIPSGGGATISGTANAASDGTFSVALSGVPVNSYLVQARVEGGYFVSPAVEDAFTVIGRTSSGFATGGGWFYWPGTEERTSFGFVANTKKSGVAKGSVVMVRHGENGDYRIKSSAVSSVNLGSGSDGNGPFGWCSISGKGVYRDRSADEGGGNFGLEFYAEDHGEPGRGVDRVWISINSPVGGAVSSLSMAPSAGQNAVPLEGGNAAIPHQALR